VSSTSNIDVKWGQNRREKKNRQKANMASKSKQKGRSSRDASRDRGARHVIVEDDVILEEVLPEEEECSQMNLLSGRDEVSSAKLQEIYDRKFAPPRPKSDSSLRGSSTRSRTIDLSSARKSATARTQAFARSGGENPRKARKDAKEEAREEAEVDEEEVEKIVKQMKAAKVYDYDAELGIRTIEAQSDDSDDDDDDFSDEDDDDDEDEDSSADRNGNRNQNKGELAKEKAKKRKKKKALAAAKMNAEAEEEGDIDPLFGKRGKCPLQLLSEFIDAVTLKEYENALNLCEMILIFEPKNEIALEFIPNLKEKIKIEEEQGTESEESSSDSDDDDDDETDSGETDDDEL